MVAAHLDGDYNLLEEKVIEAKALEAKLFMFVLVCIL
jgi:hypothetical protein